ncbi:hypothetical protein K933_08038 [Candidatus Halobonum tyrrellensis G22]|uniref:Uncharacterized protein n=1 Tax=Candidatus Halobonum tyrrellensis G22 TaxID=1324957 RepID=V4HL46_9EURY|nr:hypothetical protein K933_08038 [Candidatus Halobonum tyrrellensis G22]
MLAFTREESWVVHAALLERVREAVEAGEYDEGHPELDALRTLESDADRFAPAEVHAVHASLVGYLADAPLRDRPPARAALETTSDAL